MYQKAKENRTRIIYVVALFFSVLLLVSCKPEQQMTEEAKKMQEDLNYFTDTLEREHKNLYANVSKEEFQVAKDTIAKNLGSMSENDFYYSLKSLLSLVGDAHTDLQRDNIDASAFQVLPFQVQNYDDKWKLVVIDKQYADFLGKEVHFINQMPIAEVFEKMKGIFSYENEVRAKSLFSKQSNIWSALVFLGIAKEGSGLELGVAEEDGTIHNISIYPIGQNEISPEKVAFVQAKNLPITAKNGIYRAKDLREDVLFVQYNLCQESQDLPMEQFTKRIEEALLKNHFQKVILDFRYNPGGNSAVLEPFLQMLAARKKEKPITVYTLIGKETFSSAVMNAVRTKEMLGAVLVGTPTGGNVNAFGEVKSFSLKNFPFTVTYSTKYFSLIPDYDKDSLYPDVTIPQDLSQILSGHDAEVEWVLQQ